jgi:hypothetical protein
MSWYTRFASSFFIDGVQVAAHSGNHLVLMLNGKRYEYDVAGGPIAAKIDELKKNKTPGGKRKASEQVAVMIRNLEQYRVNREMQLEKTSL